MSSDKDQPIYKEESQQIIGCAIEVHNGLGHGFHEKPYERALVIEFGQQKISYEQQKSFIKYQKADFRPKPDVDHIYHYHANYVLPDSWQSKIDKQFDLISMTSSPFGLLEKVKDQWLCLFLFFFFYYFVSFFFCLIKLLTMSFFLLKEYVIYFDDILLILFKN